MSDPAGLLARSVVEEFGGKARFVVENYGASERARRFGVTRYPAIFVEDVLVATPKDFGFFGKGEGENEGRYAPLKSVASHERFRRDLGVMIGRLLEGDREGARAHAAPSDTGAAFLPPLALIDLDGHPVRGDALAGRVVLVELWATWCPPCRGSLRHLGELARRHGDRLTVLALAVDSDEAQVRKVASALDAPITWAMATPEAVSALGGVGAVPTLQLFDATGRAANTWYGAPPTLHRELEAALESLVR